MFIGQVEITRFAAIDSGAIATEQSDKNIRREK